MLCVVYPDAKLYTRALYTFTISSLMDVSTTWGAQTIRYHVGNYFTTSSFPDVPSLTSPAISTSSSIYSGAVATSATWPSPSPATLNCQALGVKKGPGEEGHGDTGRREDSEGQVGVRNYEEFLVLLYSTRKLSTATTSSYLV